MRDWTIVIETCALRVVPLIIQTIRFGVRDVVIAVVVLCCLCEDEQTNIVN
jgi:hypothetical protein